MLLYIARHAWAGDYGDPAWPDDSLRPLTADGVRRYRRVVAALAARGLAPERIATSPYTRCVQTAELIAGGTLHTPEIDELLSLQPGADLGELLRWTRLVHADEVAWVGHNPDVERLVAELIGDRGALLRFAKGSVAAIDFAGPPEPGAGTLQWLVTAKVLGA